MTDSAQPSAASDDSFALLWTDGAARGNPGPAGIGVMLKAPTGDVNVAEYKALLLGLELALERGVKKLEVRADSELLIKQLKGEYRVRNSGLLPLYEQAQALLARLEAFRLKHVRREQNAEADRLANEGIDRVARESAKPAGS